MQPNAHQVFGMADVLLTSAPQPIPEWVQVTGTERCMDCGGLITDHEPYYLAPFTETTVCQECHQRRMTPAPPTIADRYATRYDRAAQRREVDVRSGYRTLAGRYIRRYGGMIWDVRGHKYGAGIHRRYQFADGSAFVVRLYVGFPDPLVDPDELDPAARREYDRQLDGPALHVGNYGVGIHLDHLNTAAWYMRRHCLPPAAGCQPECAGAPALCAAYATQLTAPAARAGAWLYDFGVLPAVPEWARSAYQADLEDSGQHQRRRPCSGPDRHPSIPCGYLHRVTCPQCEQRTRFSTCREQLERLMARYTLTCMLCQYRAETTIELQEDGAARQRRVSSMPDDPYHVVDIVAAGGVTMVD